MSQFFFFFSFLCFIIFRLNEIYNHKNVGVVEWGGLCEDAIKQGFFGNFQSNRHQKVFYLF